MTSRAYLAVIVSALLLSGCAAAPRHASTSSAKRADGKAPYDFRSEGSIPADANPAPVEADVEEMPLSGDSLDVSDAPVPPPDTTRTVAPADSMADGFRIQIFATGDREVAENAARVATDRLSLPAYTGLEGGMYKVRVGDYTTRRAAEAALGTLRGHYYPDAWIVPARVKVPRTP